MWITPNEALVEARMLPDLLRAHTYCMPRLPQKLLRPNTGRDLWATNKHQIAAADSCKPRFPRWLPVVADKHSTQGVSERARPYTGTVDHDLPFYWADVLMGNPASGHFLR